MSIRLPKPFLDKMERLLGDEYGEWLVSYEHKRRYGLRVNTLKLTQQAFLRMTPWAERLTPIPWTSEAFYYEETDRPGKHLHYHAGLYYMQEPSAMVPAELLQVKPGDRVLDLCAAPGGKSTQLAAKLQGVGLLVSNDNARERTKALAKNIELAGVRNAIVLNEEPAALAGAFGAFFDKVLVDAPCSGEGMFRKDESMIAQWEKHSVERCSLMQRDILKHAAELLAPGGTLVYSTCTFSPEENEAQIAALLTARTDMEVVPVEPEYGWMSGRPNWASTEAAEAQGEPAPDLSPEAVRAVAGTVRLWPHRVAGEGHYAAVLQKSAEESEERPAFDADGESRASGTAESRSQSGRLNEKAASEPAEAGGRGGKDGRGGSGIEQDKLRSRRESGRDKDRGRHKPGRYDGTISETDTLAMWRAFSARTIPDASAWPGRLTAFGSRVYLQPEGLPALAGLKLVRAGWYLGTAGAHRFEPSQALAMGLKKAEAALALDLDADGEDALRYLKGETLHIEASRLEGTAVDGGPASGHVLVCADGYPLGWGKWSDGMLKNELAPGWRRMS
ncbi:rRNA cytosine-C5-methyltransferase [Paenibacillus darwinianus]|uniref:rRNA cytosine-C5-methyltransferase n=1 Tax=Paenibacillus darwinianus TaxID=1380763 RepID=A0A9W5S0G6_9BACL|nr:RsmB/NOP family class I SAM-dependent RNA methyltransferase [Paenibacillus darwinianus]EXX86945.1 rRNA cytosine-C5-methyltransferase [Paenibacillus darwinianus]EXX87176.1 rRNA cytosine-C5-methyltransferase [Paenibacillus darwinianus]EXX87233.1 rRNA cytosine-C5-methyltransferase [Paenibacillus darwinianus]